METVTIQDPNFLKNFQRLIELAQERGTTGCPRCDEDGLPACFCCQCPVCVRASTN